MEFNSFPYLLLIMTYILLSFYEGKRTSEKNISSVRNLRVFCAVLFLFFFGLRGYIGTDWINYEMFYLQFSNMSDSSMEFEVGFNALASLSYFLGFDYTTFVFFLTLVQVCLWHRFVSYFFKNVSISYVVLIAIFPLLIIDLQRNFTSVLIALQAIIYIQKKQKILAAIIILISITFHTTGAFFFVLFLINKSYFNKKILVGLTIIGLVVYVLQFRFFDNVIFILGKASGGRFQYLAQSVLEEEEGYGLRLGIIEKLFFMFIVFKNYNYILKFKVIHPIFLNSFFIFCFIYLYGSGSSAFVNRFSLLFFFGYLAVLSNIRFLIYDKYSAKKYLNAVFILCFIKTFVGFSPEIYRYSNNIITKDSQYMREIERAKHYSDR